jgi:di/tricarboxylate transporter
MTLALLPFLAQATAAPPLTTSMLVVLAVIGLALVFFVTEWLPIDITAIGVMVLVILLEPWTGVSPTDGISGFASTATITVLAMFILSEGVRRTGVLQVIGNKLVEWTGSHPIKQLGAVIGLSGSTAGIVNNTPVVAMMVPMVVNMAKRTKTSPSKLLMPLSFASMMGGMLTLIGTSTNILASDVSARLLGHPFSMFEFTALGAIVLVTGGLYLLLIGHRLIPERIKPEEDLTEEFEMAGYLAEVVVREDSPLRGNTVGQTMRGLGLDVDVVQMIRGGEVFPAPIANKQFRAGDELMLRTNRETLLTLLDTQGLEPVITSKITEKDFDIEEKGETLIEVVLLSDNPVVGETLQSVNFAQRFDGLVLAIRRKGELLFDRIDEIPLQGGDTLLVQASPRAVSRFSSNRTFILIQDAADATYRSGKRSVALGIVGAVVALAAFNVVPIVVSALMGVLAMVATGCVRPNEIYGAVDWSVIFLLAGVIPLGVALERSGGAAYLAHFMATAAEGLPPFAILVVFYLFTSLITQVISNNASVVLMIPVAVSAARLVGGDPFPFVMAVTFAASTAMLTPVGYQTNLMVYGPGGYRFTDFFRVGAPLQVLLALVTCAGIMLIWGV